MSDSHYESLVVPARVIPLPKTISEQSRQVLANPRMSMPVHYPPLDDKVAWKALIAEIDDRVEKMLSAALPKQGYKVDTQLIDSVVTYVVTPDDVSEGDPRVFLEFHGGGFSLGGGESCKMMAIAMALRTGARVVSVDYRMPPDHPFPAALDDAMVVYRALLESHAPENIVVGGISAGGGLTAALALRSRDEGLPMPAGLILMTPGVDLTISGDTFHTLLGIDPVLPTPVPEMLQLYAGDTPLDHPYVSPVLGRFDAGFPATFLQSGTRDLLLSSTVRMHRALREVGVNAELHVFEGMPHGGFGGTPEDMEVTKELRRFLAGCWRHPPTASR